MPGSTTNVSVADMPSARAVMVAVPRPIALKVLPSTARTLSSLLVHFASTYLPEPSLYCANAPSVAPVEGNGPLDVIGAVNPTSIEPPPTGVIVNDLMVTAAGEGAPGSPSTTPCAQPVILRLAMTVHINPERRSTSKSA